MVLPPWLELMTKARVSRFDFDAFYGNVSSEDSVWVRLLGLSHCWSGQLLNMSI